jgi:hypothetical protein
MITVMEEGVWQVFREVIYKRLRVIIIHNINIIIMMAVGGNRWVHIFRKSIIICLQIKE